MRQTKLKLASTLINGKRFGKSQLAVGSRPKSPNIYDRANKRENCGAQIGSSNVTDFARKGTAKVT